MGDAPAVMISVRESRRGFGLKFVLQKGVDFVKSPGVFPAKGAHFFRGRAMLFVQHALVHGIIPSLFLVEFSVSFRRFFVKRRVVEFCRRLRPGGEILYNGGEKGEKSMNGPMNLLVTSNEAYVPHLNVMLTSLSGAAIRRRNFGCICCTTALRKKRCWRYPGAAGRQGQLLPVRVQAQGLEDAPTSGRYPRKCIIAFSRRNICRKRWIGCFTWIRT